MRVVFRVDASTAIGSGHFMRCLSLADALSKTANETVFICRFLPQHLCTKLSDSGHRYLALETPADARPDNELCHADWLGVSQRQDAADCLAVLGADHYDWLVVDNYGLDRRWESAMRTAADRILAIDDLADRAHDCDALVDQNLYADMEHRYDGKIPEHCQLFLGPQYAFLREEFHQQRARLRRHSGNIENVLVYFGGVDAQNFTLEAINVLVDIGTANQHVDVVIGAQHPDGENIKAMCSRHKFTCHVQTGEMARLMARADLAIGAGGISAFERLYLRLPAILRPIAANQVEQLECMAAAGLCTLYNSAEKLKAELRQAFAKPPGLPADCVADGNQALVDYMTAPTGR